MGDRLRQQPLPRMGGKHAPDDPHRQAHPGRRNHGGTHPDSRTLEVGHAVARHLVRPSAAAGTRGGGRQHREEHGSDYRAFARRPGHQFHPHRPLYAAVRAGRRAHRPRRPRFHYSFSAEIGAGVRRACSSRELKFLDLRWRGADVGTSGDSQPSDLLPTNQAVRYARYVHHNSEHRRPFCAAPPRRTRQQHASAESALRVPASAQRRARRSLRVVGHTLVAPRSLPGHASEHAPYGRSCRERGLAPVSRTAAKLGPLRRIPCPEPQGQRPAGRRRGRRPGRTRVTAGRIESSRTSPRW